MSANLPAFSTRAGLVRPFQSLGGVSALVSGLSDHNTLVWWRFLPALRPLFSPLSRGFPKLSEGLALDCRPPETSNHEVLCQWSPKQ